MAEFHNAFLSRSFLRSVWALEYESFRKSDEESQLRATLEMWSKRKDLKETSAESAFLQTFFIELWGYSQSGHQEKKQGFTLYPKYAVKGAGDRGGPGEADLAIGWFDNPSLPATPQVLCEFKDIRSDLDAPQKRRGTARSPVKQCLDYLGASRREMYGTESILPTWAIVTDMNEFRLYWYDRAPQQYIRFVIRPQRLFDGSGLLADSEESRFDRFLFSKLFRRDVLLSTGGKAPLAQLILQQWVKQRELENEFYQEYRTFRETLYREMLISNPHFPGTKGRLVRLAQKILDRCIFIFYCEDMGRALGFPPQLLRNFLVHESRDNYFDPKATTVWQRLLTLFKAMNDGSAFGGEKLNQFNGGLFAGDPELEELVIPNAIFCQPKQGENEASLARHKQTLLYLSATFNYASGWEDALKRSPAEVADGARREDKSLGLYTLGHIFEQSITELEILEAEADNRPSINKITKRKRDGVYYTPEWVVERIVEETLGARISELKRECGWPDDDLPNAQAIDDFRERLTKITIVDPACGSGAFLIASLRHLLREWHVLQEVRRQVLKDNTKREDDMIVRDILRANIYGVDINPSAVEIAQLALWLHTARSDRPLSSLARTIRDGNSLIDSTFYKGQTNLALYSDEEKDRVHTFDWETEFGEVFDRGKFDVVVGNPPYVKLQYFRRVHADMAEYLRDGRPTADYPGYQSAKTGNFDMYLPFIEKGLELLSENGRLGYIAPSLWTVNVHGAGLRDLIGRTRQLERWLDFKSYQIFEEATNYTALQLFTKRPNECVKIAFSPHGPPPERPWDDPTCELPYQKLQFGERWLLLSGGERKLIDALYDRCSRLDDCINTESIFVGIQTSADSIFHLRRLGPGRYLSTPKGEDAPPPYEVSIEDELLKPLVSGPDAKRYVSPEPETYLLFPYQLSGEQVHLISQFLFENKYPNAWKYLLAYEKELRKREATLDAGGEFKIDKAGNMLKAPFNDDAWYRFGRHQGLDKQEIKKLIVAQTVPSLRVCFDDSASLYLNNVRVNGIVASSTSDPWFLLGVLNGPVADFVFRRIAKPKDGGWFEANKQFIAPLPIPPASAEQRTQVGCIAMRLQEAHTIRRDTLNEIARRMETATVRKRSESFLLPDIVSAKGRVGLAPRGLEPEQRVAWAKAAYSDDLNARYAAIGARLRPGVALAAEFSRGELTFLIDGIRVLERIFLSDADGVFVVAQWKVIASTFSISERTDGETICTALRKLAHTDNTALRDQIIALEQDLAAIENTIKERESEMNELLYQFYALSKADIEMIEKG